MRFLKQSEVLEQTRNLISMVQNKKAVKTKDIRFNSETDGYYMTFDRSACFRKKGMANLRLNGKTPCKLWNGKAPNVSWSKQFKCRVSFMHTNHGKTKCELRSKEG